jgi:hypothetical protein
MEPTQLTEFLALIEDTLGGRLDKDTRRPLQKIQKDFIRPQARLVHNLDMGIVGQEEYLGRLNALLTSMMDRMRAVLGEGRFEIVFGEGGRHPQDLVDRRTFLEAVAAERRSAR